MDKNTHIKEILTSRFRQQYIGGASDEIFNAIKRIIEIDGLNDPRLRQQLADIQSGRWDIDDEKREKIEELLKQFSPKAFKDRLIQEVSLAPYLNIKTEGGYINLSEQRAKELAAAIGESGMTDLMEVVEMLLAGEQRQTFSFAVGLSQYIDDRDTFMANVLARFDEVKPEEQNPAFILGIASGIKDDEFTRKMIKMLIASQNSSFHAIRLTRLLPIVSQDLVNLRPVVEKNHNYVEELEYLNLRDLATAELIGFVDWLSTIGQSGILMAIDVIYDAIREDEGSWDGLKQTAISLVEKVELSGGIREMRLTSLERVINKLLDDPGNPDWLGGIIDGLFAIGRDNYSWPFETVVRMIMFGAMNKNWDAIWPKIGNALLEGEDNLPYNMAYILKYFREYDDDKLFAWAEENGVAAAVQLLGFIDFQDREKNDSFSFLVMRLLENYYTDGTILNELSGRLHSYSISGSAIDLLVHRRSMVEKLVGHDKAEIREFAQREKSYFDREITREQEHMKNFGIGEW